MLAVILGFPYALKFKLVICADYTEYIGNSSILPQYPVYPPMQIQEVSWKFKHFINSLCLSNDVKHFIGIMQ